MIVAESGFDREAASPSTPSLAIGRARAEPCTSDEEVRLLQPISKGIEPALARTTQRKDFVNRRARRALRGERRTTRPFRRAPTRWE